MFDKINVDGGPVNRLASEIKSEDAVTEALSHTRLKGLTYEKEIVQALRTWARGTGLRYVKGQLRRRSAGVHQATQKSGSISPVWPSLNPEGRIAKKLR